MPHKKETVKQRRIGESGYVLPDHIPPGEIVKGLKSEDDGVKKKSWRIGKSIGKQYDILPIFGTPGYSVRMAKIIKFLFSNNVKLVLTTETSKEELFAILI